MDALSGRPSLILAPEPVTPGMTVGLYGGSFNPPHSGHAHVAETALSGFGLDRVWVLVSPQNPLKSSKHTAPYEKRLNAARRLIAEPRILVSDLEARLGADYSVETVAALRARYRSVRFVLIMGADSFAGLHRWRDWRALADMAPVGVIARPGFTLAAQLCPAAKMLRRAHPRELWRTSPPAWSYLTAPFNTASSTAIRSA